MPRTGRRPWFIRLIGGVALLAFAYDTVAYLVLPWLWSRYERRRAHHPDLPEAPRMAVTGSGIPGDPLNLALIGPEDHIRAAMRAAGWYPADPLGFHADWRIVEDVLRDRPYPDAPVSSLYVWGRKQDLAYEQPVGDSPRRRHHVRFWRSPNLDEQGRHLWLGAATFDEGVTLSRDTGQITHRIAPDIDTERGKVIADLQRVGWILEQRTEPGIAPLRSGVNGSGDPFYTDGMMVVAVLEPPGVAAANPAVPATAHP